MEELIPGLPDEIARECLIRIHYDTFPTARSVCRLWQREIRSSFFHRLRKTAGLTTPVIAFAQAEPPLAPAASGPAKKYASSASPSYRLTLFEPLTGDWSCLPPIPGLPHGLPLFSNLAAVDRELVVIGGWDPETWAASDGVYIYDFTTGAWRRGAPMPGPRRSFFACAASADLRTVFVAGGHDEEKNALRSAMAYDLAADAWTPMPDMAQDRDECRGAFLRGAFHVIGGYPTEAQGRFSRSAEAFDVAAWRWGPVEEDKLEAGTCPRACVADDGGRLYACRPGGGIAALSEDESGSWRVVAEVPEDARVAPLMVAWDRTLMLMGSEKHGGDHVGYVAETLECKAAMTWRRVAVPEEYSGHVQAGCYMQI
ncbi:hypothetical protein Cni_G16886 [Canna indica]|uniref:F-box/kelch-repeat protein n=1 Tax=Canna indica TaxID=4628 RepID=A0AAQ3KGS8_9LILI|nr:hypothetical protein Cni_G16886 [Canna indica]